MGELCISTILLRAMGLGLVNHVLECVHESFNTTAVGLVFTQQRENLQPCQHKEHHIQNAQNVYIQAPRTYFLDNFVVIT